jgi:hypothetical protein
MANRAESAFGSTLYPDQITLCDEHWPGGSGVASSRSVPPGVATGWVMVGGQLLLACGEANFRQFRPRGDTAARVEVSSSVRVPSKCPVGVTAPAGRASALSSAGGGREAGRVRELGVRHALLLDLASAAERVTGYRPHALWPGARTAGLAAVSDRGSTAPARTRLAGEMHKDQLIPAGPGALARTGIRFSFSAPRLICGVVLPDDRLRANRTRVRYRTMTKSLIYVRKLAGSRRCWMLSSPDGRSVTDQMVSYDRGYGSARRGGPRPRARLASSAFLHWSSRPDRERECPARDHGCER